MMQDRSRQWVAYHGANRLGFGTDDLELYQRCVSQGYDPTDLLITSVEPEEPVWYI
jgi:hypothetical protein